MTYSPILLSRRGFGLAAVSAGAAVALAGCVGTTANTTQASNNAGPKDSGTVEFWTVNLKKNFSGYINGLITAYKAKYPNVTINWVDVPGADITSKLLAAVAGNRAPDLVNYTSDTIGLFADAMTDLTQYFSDSELGVFQPTLLGPLKQKDGRLPAIPWYNGGGGSLAVYRKKYVIPAGFTDATAPKTFQQCLDFAQKVHVTSNVAGTDLMPYSTNLMAQGVQFLSADRKTAIFNTSDTAAILTNFKKYYDSGAIARGAVGPDSRKYEQAIATDNLAFSADDQGGILTVIKAAAPQIYTDLAIGSGAVGAPGKYFLVAQQVFGVPKTSSHIAAAVEFGKFITSAQNQLTFCKIVPILPSTTATVKDPSFVTKTGDPVADTAHQLVIENYSALADGSLGSGNDSALFKLLDDQVRAFMSGSVSVSDALSKATDSWNQALSKQRSS